MSTDLAEKLLGLLIGAIIVALGVYVALHWDEM
jgi:hypothetical protein